MKQNKIDNILVYFFAIIFIGACAIGGTIGGNKLSELRDKNKEDNKVNIINEVIDNELVAYKGTEIVLNDVVYCTDCNYSYVDKRDNSIKSIIVNKDKSYSIDINGNIINFNDGSIESISTLFINNDLYFIFKVNYNNSGESLLYNENGELVKKLSNSKLFLSFDIVKLFREDKNNGDYYLMYNTCDNNTLNYHRLRLADFDDSIYYSINNTVCNNE